MTNPYSLDPATAQSIGTSSDWTYQSTSPTPLSSTFFPLTSVSADGDPFCTDIFCQDNNFSDFDPDTALYDYFRVTHTISRVMGPEAPISRPTGTSPWYKRTLNNGNLVYSVTTTTLSCTPNLKWVLPCGETGAELPWLHNQTLNMGCTVLNSNPGSNEGGFNAQTVIGTMHLVQKDVQTGLIYLPVAIAAGFNGLFSGTCNTPAINIEGYFEFLYGTINGGQTAPGGYGIINGQAVGTITQWTDRQYPHIQ